MSQMQAELEAEFHQRRAAIEHIFLKGGRQQ